MANNHQGSVEHAKTIINSFADLANKKEINAGIKFQFRQLDTFIHDDYKNADLKFVKRFNSTKLTKNEFVELAEHSRKSGLKVIATAFDNESVPWLDEMNVNCWRDY